MELIENKRLLFNMGLELLKDYCSNYDENHISIYLNFSEKEVDFEMYGLGKFQEYDTLSIVDIILEYKYLHEVINIMGTSLKQISFEIECGKVMKNISINDISYPNITYRN